MSYKLSSLTLSLLTTALPSVVLGCKCVDSDGKAQNGLTQHCCVQLGGWFRFGNDCYAGSISEDLYDFRLCCGDEWPLSEVWRGSDCDYPEYSVGSIRR
ncbi:hypothetical protein CP533_0817 [Ophiocordyceps camponoti-saundersi (nom. inval.)]|nr:hypothetical protein CP533_0817 [Ophiocordyceps camponoti-saundersi (nom. inval.)]